MAGGGFFFTHTALTAGFGDLLYLYQHMALKGACEAVVEGHGSILAMHANPRRKAPPLP